MKYLHLLWRNLLRRKLRTIFTFLSIVVAFFLFGLLSAVRYGFEVGVELAATEIDHQLVADLIATASRSTELRSNTYLISPGAAALVFLEHNGHNRDWDPIKTTEYARRMSVGCTATPSGSGRLPASTPPRSTRSRRGSPLTPPPRRSCSRAGCW